MPEPSKAEMQEVPMRPLPVLLGTRPRRASMQAARKICHMVHKGPGCLACNNDNALRWHLNLR